MQDQVKLAIFDFDDTMRRGDSIAALIRYASGKGVIRRWQLPHILWTTLMYLRGFRSEQHAKAVALSFMAHMPVPQQEAFFRAFANDVLIPQIYPDARQTLLDHAAAGRLAVIVSASPDCYMRFLSPALPLTAVLATPVDTQGQVGTNCKGPEKMKRIIAWADENKLRIDWARSYGYGDGVTDASYLQQVGFPVAVNATEALWAAVPGIQRVTWQERKAEESQ